MNWIILLIHFFFWVNNKNDLIRFKTKTTQELTDLEKEILSYDLSKRDDFFNCHKALNTHIRLEKITQSEIKRIDHKVRNERIQKVRKEQTEAQLS